MPSGDLRHAPLTRSSDNRLLAGVCGGLATRLGVDARIVRLAFLGSVLLAGLGIVVYIAFTIILPAEGETEDGGLRSVIVGLAVACAAIAGLATLALIATLMTVFGFGGIVVAVACLLLAVALWRGSAGVASWALAPVAALTLPVLTVTAMNARLVPRTSDVVAAPAVVSDIPGAGYKTGLGSVFVDLRHTQLPQAGRVNLRIVAGLRRTIVALPHDRCVRVEVRHDVDDVPRDIALALASNSWRTNSDITLFGQIEWVDGVSRSWNWKDGPQSTGPILAIDFRSAGAGLIVRDYSDAVDPRAQPDWPGYPVYLEDRPDTTGTPRRAAQRLIKNWRERRRDQLQSKHRIDRLLPGPCGPKASS
ncbi:MAG TPA: PspC domain-containing protein [Baekduia sp.]|nr:PspC domain-containing protein [Baekduia sp.]